MNSCIVPVVHAPNVTQLSQGYTSSCPIRPLILTILLDRCPTKAPKVKVNTYLHGLTHNLIFIVRHNGVIIEPVANEAQKNKEDGDNEAGSSGSKPESRSTSPTAKTKGKARGKKNAGTPTALANPGTAGPSSGPSSYYRQHTMQNGAPHIRRLYLLTSFTLVVFSPQGLIMDPQQYAQNNLGLPTSATRLHQASWPPPPPWAAEGPQAQMGTISYHPGSQPGFYQPSPYYRQNGATMSGGPVMQQQFVTQPQNGVSSNATPTKDNHSSHTNTPATQANSSQQSGDVEMKDASKQGTGDGQSVPVAPVIDPSLDVSTPAAQTGHAQGGGAGGSSQSGQEPTAKPVSLEITQAAMEAVLSAQRESGRASGTPDAGIVISASPTNGHVIIPSPKTNGSQQQIGVGVLQGNGGAGMASNSSGGGDTKGPSPPHTTGRSPFAAPVQPQPAMRPEPMEQMLTEDGEPMLNPGLSPSH